MQRTYSRPKKPMVCGALNSGGIILPVAENNYNYDVFSIKKLKQSKQEISCLSTCNQSGPRSRVRKRKYVKKVVKEIEPTFRESLESQCTYLTPDKSLRVNKAQDAFDLLFASLSPKPNNDRNKKDDTQQNKSVKRIKKTYCGKGISKQVIKKFNYSTSSGSEKENESGNMTDLRQHELMIEKDMKKSVDMEDSIDEIIFNVSMLKYTNIQYSEQKPSFTNNRPTLNLSSPCFSKSPLCSTPFSKKLRGKSIYSKFSPIYTNNSINNDGNNTEQGKENVSDHIEIKQCIEQENSLENILINDLNEENNTSSETLPPESNHIQHISKLSKSNSHSSNTNTPLYGFPNNIGLTNNTQNELVVSPLLPTNERKSIILPTSFRKAKSYHHTNKSSSSSSIFCDNTDSIEKDKSSTNDLVEMSGDQEPFLGFSEKTIVESNQNNQMIEINFDCSYNKDCMSMNSNADESYEEATIIEGESALSENKTYNSDNIINETDCSSTGEECDSFNSATGLEQSVSAASNESMYDTICDSFDEDENIACGIANTQPVVKLTRIDKDVFEQNWKPSENEESLSISVSSGEANNSLDEKEEPHISFVTTRRRNDVTRESSIQVIDESDDSSNYSGGSETILGNDLLVKDIDGPVMTEIQHAENIHKMTELENSSKEDVKMTSSRVTFGNVSAIQPEEHKPAIVLKPGKKWERSLSIYKRMTMLNETDTSLLDDLEVKHKGRKYRESIIDTMELQERGPLHNESFSSCRNTNACYKPSRSTVRIAKECSSRLSVHSTGDVFYDITGFLSEDCDDTLVELSKLSLAEDHEVTVLEKVADEPHDRAPTARDYVLRRCNQTEVLFFDECYPETVLKNCHKIGEGVYGEVFLWRAQDHARVMKVVPVSGSVKVNGEPQKDFHEIISEIVIAMELSALRSPIADIERHFDEATTADELDLRAIENATDVFNEVLAVRCVIGKYPSRLLDLWELYDECKGSENDNPAALPLDQQYIVLELANAGQDLESYHFNNAEQAYALFLQVAFALAVGEEAFQFEHRDFHWGNVLIAPTEQKYATFVLRGRVHRILRRGVAATIIDYSLSRLSLPLGDGERVALYNDLATDEGLFDAVGDYQFDIYRLMRDKLINNWKTFEPYTNILWLHYTVDKMITALRYKRVNTKIHKHFISKLKGIKNRILDYESAVQFVLTDNEF